MYEARLDKEKVSRMIKKSNKKNNEQNLHFCDRRIPFLQLYKKGKFTSQEDDELKRLFSELGPDWNEISKIMNRTARQVRERYVNHLSPPATRNEWSETEDNLLLEKVIDLGYNWSNLTPFFPGKNKNQLKNRYHLLQHYLMHEEKLSRMSKRILRTGTLYSWINDPSDQQMIGTGTNPTTRASVRSANTIPTSVRRSIASNDGVAQTSEFSNVLSGGQKPDAGHIRSNQNGGFGDEIITVFPQNPQINRGNYLQGEPTYDLWRYFEDFEFSLNSNGQTSFNTVMLYNKERQSYEDAE